MRAWLLVPAAILLLAAATCGRREAAAPPSAGVAIEIPPADTLAAAALATSPRHGEMVDVPYQPPLRTWVVYPERSTRAPVVLVIHEIFGLTEWIRGVADHLAADGFIAVVPDLVSGLGPGGGGTDAVGSRDQVVQLVRGLTPEETRRRLDATRAWALRLPAAGGRLATLGFCWGGSRSFEYACSQPGPDAAVVFYGASPDSALLIGLKAPVQGHYGGDDARVNATIEPARALIARRGGRYEVHVHEGAGHGFLRAQGGRDGANARASRDAWPRAIAFLREHLD